MFSGIYTLTYKPGLGFIIYYHFKDINIIFAFQKISFIFIKIIISNGSDKKEKAYYWRADS